MCGQIDERTCPEMCRDSRWSREPRSREKTPCPRHPIPQVDEVAEACLGYLVYRFNAGHLGSGSRRVELAERPCTFISKVLEGGIAAVPATQAKVSLPKAALSEDRWEPRPCAPGPEGSRGRVAAIVNGSSGRGNKVAQAEEYEAR